MKTIIAVIGPGIADEATEKEAEEIGRLIAGLTEWERKLPTDIG